MSVPTPQPDHTLHIQLEGFDGPLDLLLHLIRKHELDIMDIPIAFVTEEYLRYIDAMHQLDLGVAGEYLVMAATLLQIKSRMLLPRPEPEEDEDVEDFDPREMLVRRLLEYQRYRDVAGFLGDADTKGRDVFTRPSRAPRLRAEAGPAELLPINLFHLLDTYRHLFDDKPPEAMHEVTPDSMSLREMITTLADYIAETPRTTLLELLYLDGPEPSRFHVVMTFLALLEMAKLRLVRLFQSRLSSSDLIVERAVLDHDEVAQTLAALDDPDAELS